MSSSKVKYHATYGFEPKPHSHTPNLSCRPNFLQAPLWLQAIHFASFGPCWLHQIT